MTRYTLLLQVSVLILLFANCASTGNEKAETGISKMDVNLKTLDQLNCDEITAYPTLFSYSSSDLKEKLDARAITPLLWQEKEVYFKRDSSPGVIFDSAFTVLPVAKVSFSKSKIVIYLIREIQVSSTHSEDQLVMVLYDSKARPADILAGNLQDNYSSTFELNFTARTEFEIIDTDNEYSPDPESEAEDIKNGRDIEPVASTIYYKVDTSKLKFKTIKY